MSVDLHQLIALLSAGTCIAVLAVATIRFEARSTWQVPATFCVLFLAFSLVAVAQEGPFGFWTEHVRNLWGNQIWMDLLLGIGAAWLLALPRMRAVGMRPLPWLALVLGTGCIGLMAMLARLLFLEGARSAATTPRGTATPAG